MSESVSVQVLHSIEDIAALPEGTRIATNNNWILELEQDVKGNLYWNHEDDLFPYQPRTVWLPAYVLPPVVTE